MFAKGDLMPILCPPKAKKHYKDNVVIDESHHALLTDFGLSKETILAARVLNHAFIMVLKASHPSTVIENYC